MTDKKTITFLAAYERAATHFYGAPYLVKYIGDIDEIKLHPDKYQKIALDSTIKLRVLRNAHTEVVKTLNSSSNIACKIELEEKRDSLDAEIQSCVRKLCSTAEIDAYETRYIETNYSARIFEMILNAVSTGKLTSRLLNGPALSIEYFCDEKKGKFFPDESFGEFLIENKTYRDFVVLNEDELEKWLINQDVKAGKLDTPEKRMIRCEHVYRERLQHPSTENVSKENHFSALSKAIPGLQRQEFEAVRVRLKAIFPSISRPGRPKKLSNKSM